MPPSVLQIVFLGLLLLTACGAEPMAKKLISVNPGLTIGARLSSTQIGLGPNGMPMMVSGSGKPSTVRPIEPFRYQFPDLLSRYPERTPSWRDPESLCRVPVLTELDLEEHYGIPRIPSCGSKAAASSDSTVAEGSKHLRRGLGGEQEPGLGPAPTRHRRIILTSNQYAGPERVALYFQQRYGGLPAPLQEPWDVPGASNGSDAAAPAGGGMRQLVYLDIPCLHHETRKGNWETHNYLTPYLESIGQHPALRNAEFIVYASSPRSIEFCYKSDGPNANRAHIFLRVEESQRCPTSPTRYLNLPYLSINRPIVRDLSERNGTIALISACLTSKASVGGVIRAALVEALANEPGAAMQCTHFVSNTPKDQRRVVPPEVLITIYEHTRFCLLPPGDTPSSRRLGDVILAGCIPVFIGPHWHTAPLSEIGLDYTRFALFYTIDEFDKFIDERPSNVFTALPPAWLPYVKSVQTPQALYSDLMAIPSERLEPMYRALAEVQPLFDMSDKGQLVPLLHQYICAQNLVLE